jgi:glycosyltransferase involved in cell wall biosynthesis
MKNRRIKVFFLTYYPPVPTMGGAMAFYRHFFERDDFEVFVATNDKNVLNHHLPCEVLVFERSRVWERLTKTRLYRFAHSLQHLLEGEFILNEVLAAARRFQPDVIFTIAGTWGSTTRMAEKLSKELGVPLATSFNDWFDFSIIIHPAFRSILEQRFRSVYRNSDVAFCTSDGMKNALGPHANARVLFPTGGLRALMHSENSDPVETGSVVFAGNLGNWYGPMLERLVKASQSAELETIFRIYGDLATWGADFDQFAKSKNIFRGHLPFQKLLLELRKADVLLLMMGFGKDCELVERTSFKTKFLDYLSVGRPVFVWGPPYCSAVGYAKEFDSAEVCTEENPTAAALGLSRLLADSFRKKELTVNAERMYADRFHPDKIHQVFLDGLRHIPKRCE